MLEAGINEKLRLVPRWKRIRPRNNKLNSQQNIKTTQSYGF